jgi:hypothetical protein
MLEEEEREEAQTINDVETARNAVKDMVTA